MTCVVCSPCRVTLGAHGRKKKTYQENRRTRVRSGRARKASKWGIRLKLSDPCLRDGAAIGGWRIWGNAQRKKNQKIKETGEDLPSGKRPTLVVK